MKISTRQFTFLVFLFTVGSSILFIPPIVTSVAKQDAWISMLIGILMNFLIIGIYLLLAKLCKNRNLYEMTQYLFGKWLGAFLTIVFMIYSFLSGGTSVLYEVGYFLSTQLFSNTPVIMINAMFALIILMALRLGLGTFARASEILVPVFIFLLFISTVSVSPEINVEKLKPAFQTELKSILKAALYFNAFSCFPLIIFLTIYPKNVQENKKAALGLLFGTMIGGIVLLMLTTVDIMVLGADNTSHYTFPGYVLAQRINIGGFFTRIEVMMSALWMISFFYKMVIYFYATIQGLVHLTTAKSSKIFTVSLMILAVILSVDLHSDTISFNEWSKSTWPASGVFIGLIIPIIMILLAIIKGKRKATSTK